MSVIYFDDTKSAFAVEIEDAIASVDQDVWQYYCRTEAGTAWDIIDGKFIQLIPLDQMANKEFARERMMDLKFELSRTDYKAIKFSEGELTEQEYAPIREQRRQWRAEINRLEQL